MSLSESTCSITEKNGNETVNDEEEWLVSCRCESSRAVTTLLSCLNHISRLSSSSGSVGYMNCDSEQDQQPQSYPSLRRGQVGMKRRQNRASNSSSLQNQIYPSRVSTKKLKRSLQPVTVVCSATGLTFHAYDKAKQMQASIDLQASWFSEYNIQSSSSSVRDNVADELQRPDWQSRGQFCINLTTVLECLQVLGNASNSAGSTLGGTNHSHSTSTSNHSVSKLFMAYNVPGEYFIIELLQEDMSLLVTSAIPSIMSPLATDDDDNEYADQSSLTLAFRSSPIAGRIIVKSDALKDVFNELDCIGSGTVGTSTVVTVALSKEDGLEFAVVNGPVGNECWIRLPAKGGHVVSIEFDSTVTTSGKKPKPHSYGLSALIESLRIVTQLIAQETCVTINQEGMMAIQHQVIDTSISESPSFIDYIMCCYDESNDEDDYNDVAGNNNSVIQQHQHHGRDLTVSSDASTTSQPLIQHAWTQDDDSTNRSVRPLITNELTTRGSNRNQAIVLDDNSMDAGDDAQTCESDDNDDPASSSQLLFGSVIDDDKINNRNVRPRMHRDRRNILVRGYKDTGSRRSRSRSGARSSVIRNRKSRMTRHQLSQSLLDESSSNDANNERDTMSVEDPEESEPIDITAPASPPPQCRNDEDDDCSSPELVYGRQY